MRERLLRACCTSLYGSIVIIFLTTAGYASSAVPDMATAAQAGSTEPAENTPTTIYQKISQHLTLAMALSASVRYDRLQWNIAGSMAGTSPNVLSELEWTDIVSHQLTLSGHAAVGRHLYLRGHFNYAWIQRGETRDSDYAGDNHTGEWSRSISETNGDQLWDVMGGGGYPFRFLQGRLLIAPMLGFSVHKQDLRITNGFQVVSSTPPPEFQTTPPPVGPFNRPLNSLYAARMVGFWTGCDLHYQLAAAPGKLPLMAWGVEAAYHFWGDYSAEADWNLREQLQHPVSFRHNADGTGLSLTGEWGIRLARRLTINLTLKYTRWSTEDGVHTVYLIDGTTQSTRLNETVWESRSLMVGVAYRFF